MPNYNQLQHVIAQGNDTNYNRLVLNLNGDFELHLFNNAGDQIKFDQLNYVTRWETFDAGNDYVGFGASNDQKFLNSIMDWANEAWNMFQNTGQTKILNPSI